MTRSRWLVLFALPAGIGLGAAPAAAQQVWQADVRVQAIDVTALKGHVNIRVVVYSDLDASASNVSLRLFLPVGTKAARVPPGCQPSPSAAGAVQARVDCALGELRVRDLREVTIVTTEPAPGVIKRFAAFAYSDTPDPQLANNYAERVLP